MAYMPGVSELVFLSQSSQKRDCAGCMVAPAHVEDVGYTRDMMQFPVDKAALQEEHRQRVARFVRLSENPSAPPEDLLGEQEHEADTPGGAVTDPNFFLHKVSPKDTLTGLALHYKTSEHAIVSANEGQIIGTLFQHLEFIRIPRVVGVRARECDPLAPNEAEQIVVKDFIRLSKKITSEKVTKEEAMYYCMSTDYVLSDALKMFKEDIEATMG